MAKSYNQILNAAYQKYKEDWCKIRNYPLEEVEAADANDEEYNGEMFACLFEFEDGEFQDEGYMECILSDEDFARWKEF